MGKVFSGESRDEKSIPVIFSIRGDVSSSIRARDMKNLVPIPKRNQNPVLFLNLQYQSFSLQIYAVWPKPRTEFEQQWRWKLI